MFHKKCIKDFCTICHKAEDRMSKLIDLTV